MVLSRGEVNAIYEAAIRAGLASQHDALVSGLPAAFRESLPAEGAHTSRLLNTLNILNETPALIDGTDPFVVWLDAAQTLSKSLPEQSIFRDAREKRLRHVDEALTPVPPPVASKPPASLPPPSSIIPTPVSSIPISMPVSSGRLPEARWTAPDALPPPPKVRFHFVGRDAELVELKRILTPREGGPHDKPRSVVVTGIGGIGKTALAMRFAEKNLGSFPGGILWGDLGIGGNPREVARSIVSKWWISITSDRGAPSGRERPLDQYLALVSREVASRIDLLGACLIILDNADTREAALPIINSFSHCSILITSRGNLSVRHMHEVNLKGLGRKASIEYVKGAMGHLFGRVPERLLGDLLDHIQDHPLGLDLLTRALKQDTHLDVAGLLTRIKDSARYLRHADLDLTTHVPQNVQDCFRSSIAELPRGPLLPFLIATASQSAAPWSIEAADYVSGVCDHRTTVGLLDDLTARGLVSSTGDGHYQIHRLLSAYLRATHARRGFGRLPRTWEVPSLAWLLMRIAPRISAGKAAYDTRQEHHSLRYAREHSESLSELNKERPSILHGLERRAKLGFGDAMRARIEILRDYLQWADLSNLKLRHVVLDGVDLTGAQLRGADFSGDPPRVLPTFPSFSATLYQMCAEIAVASLALGLSLFIYVRLVDAPWNRSLLVLAPVALVGAAVPLAEIILKSRLFQKGRYSIDIWSMRVRYVIERFTEVTVFWALGVLSSFIIVPLSGYDSVGSFILSFTKITAVFSVFFGIVTWFTYKLARLAHRLEVGGLGIRMIQGAAMAISVLLSPIAMITALDGATVEAITKALPPMVLYAASIGIRLSPERHLLTSLRVSYLREAKLCGADLSHAVLTWAKLGGADLTAANLSRAKLNGADLRRATLERADLTCAELRGADLRDADLTCADLRGADLTEADLTGAKLECVIDDSTQWPENIERPSPREAAKG